MQVGKLNIKYAKRGSVNMLIKSRNALTKDNCNKDRLT